MTTPDELNELRRLADDARNAEDWQESYLRFAQKATPATLLALLDHITAQANVIARAKEIRNHIDLRDCAVYFRDVVLDFDAVLKAAEPLAVEDTLAHLAAARADVEQARESYIRQALEDGNTISAQAQVIAAAAGIRGLFPYPENLPNDRHPARDVVILKAFDAVLKAAETPAKGEADGKENS